jgi:hypothetical protein
MREAEAKHGCPPSAAAWTTLVTHYVVWARRGEARAAVRDAERSGVEVDARMLDALERRGAALSRVRTSAMQRLLEGGDAGARAAEALHDALKKAGELDKFQASLMAGRR